MRNNAQMAAEMLRSAAGFFRSLAASNPEAADQMLEHAETYDIMAGLVEIDPLGGEYPDQEDEDA